MTSLTWQLTSLAKITSFTATGTSQSQGMKMDISLIVAINLLWLCESRCGGQHHQLLCLYAVFNICASSLSLSPLHRRLTDLEENSLVPASQQVSPYTLREQR